MWRKLLFVLAHVVLAGSAAAPAAGQVSLPELFTAAALPWREVALGAVATPASWALYSSTTVAPFGGLDRDGMRLRLGSGYGRYHYDTLPPARGDCRYGFGDGRTRRIDGRASFADVLAGYQARLGITTVKAFAGIAIDQQSLKADDICNPTRGRDSGVKAALETWSDLTPALWLALDGNWTAAHRTHGVRARIGYRITPPISLGLEHALVGNAGGRLHRVGVFGRYEWGGGEVALAAGVGGEQLAAGAVERDDTWAQLSVMLRY